MAIEVPVRKEIASFKSRPVGGLTVRQLICFVIALPIGFGGGYILAQKIGFDAASSIMLPLILPVFVFGMFEKDGYTLEKYLRILWRHRVWEQKTVYKTENAVFAYMPEEEVKQDLASRMLSYSPRTLRVGEETNVLFHWTDAEKQKNIRTALRECRQSGTKEVAWKRIPLKGSSPHHAAKSTVYRKAEKTHLLRP